MNSTMALMKKCCHIYPEELFEKGRMNKDDKYDVFV